MRIGGQGGGSQSGILLRPLLLAQPSSSSGLRDIETEFNHTLWLNFFFSLHFVVRDTGAHRFGRLTAPAVPPQSLIIALGYHCDARIARAAKGARKFSGGRERRR